MLILNFWTVRSHHDDHMENLWLLKYICIGTISLPHLFTWWYLILLKFLVDGF